MLPDPLGRAGQGARSWSPRPRSTALDARELGDLELRGVRGPPTLSSDPGSAPDHLELSRQLEAGGDDIEVRASCAHESRMNRERLPRRDRGPLRVRPGHGISHLVGGLAQTVEPTHAPALLDLDAAIAAVTALRSGARLGARGRQPSAFGSAETRARTARGRGRARRAAPPLARAARFCGVAVPLGQRTSRELRRNEGGRAELAGRPPARAPQRRLSCPLTPCSAHPATSGTRRAPRGRLPIPLERLQPAVAVFPHRLGHGLGHDEVAVPLGVRRHDVPRRVLARSNARKTSS